MLTVTPRVAPVPSCHVAHMLHVMSVRCVARDLHANATWPLQCTCWRQFAAQWGDCKNLELRLSLRSLSSLSLSLSLRICWQVWMSRPRRTLPSRPKKPRVGSWPQRRWPWPARWWPRPCCTYCVWRPLCWCRWPPSWWRTCATTATTTTSSPSSGRWCRSARSSTPPSTSSSTSLWGQGSGTRCTSCSPARAGLTRLGHGLGCTLSAAVVPSPLNPRVTAADNRRRPSYLQCLSVGCCLLVLETC